MTAKCNLISRCAPALVIGAIAALSLFIAACSGDPEMPAVSISATDYAFSAPDSLPAGLTRLTLTNTGKEAHHAQLLRLNDGISLDQLQAALATGPEQVLALVALVGGPGAIAPAAGGPSTVVLDLKPGEYALICFLSGADGVPHLAKGMVKPLRVVAPKGGRPKEPPVAGSIRLTDFAISMPSVVSKGAATFKVANDGAQPHEVVFVRPVTGKTIPDLVRYLSSQAGPPPFEHTGGMQALSPGLSGFLVHDFTPGRYAAVCTLPDPATGKSHAALGMVKEFSVQ